MVENGFKVTKQYLGLETAWRAEYTQGVGGRVIGINAEMDALPGIGHACGHNLIAIAGVGVAIALRAALKTQPHVSGTIVLLGTPGKLSFLFWHRQLWVLMTTSIFCSGGRWWWQSYSIGTRSVQRHGCLYNVQRVSYVSLLSR